MTTGVSSLVKAVNGSEFELDLSALARQFSGRRFGELVLHQRRNLDYARTVAAFQGTIAELPPAVQPMIESWIDKNAAQGVNAEFWKRDCGEVFRNICDAARLQLGTALSDATDEQVFNMFQIVLLNFAYGLHKYPASKAFVQKSLGMGLFRRLVCR